MFGLLSNVTPIPYMIDSSGSHHSNSECYVHSVADTNVHGEVADFSHSPYPFAKPSSRITRGTSTRGSIETGWYTTRCFSGS